MSSLFAPYAPGRGEQSTQVAVVDLAAEHIPRCVEIALQREGGHADAWGSRFVKALTAPDQVTLVALVEAEVVGYGSAGRLTPRTSDPDAGVPDGWYLTGVVVDPAYRRRGVASRLTEARLRWLSGRTGRVWYFVSDQNPASIDLHARFGFGLVARDIRFPGVSVTGSALLYAIDLSRSADGTRELGQFDGEIGAGRFLPAGASEIGVEEEISGE